MSQMPIDLDAEAIYFEGHWYTRDDLARRIKAMLDAGDFAVTRPSAALEQLTSVISSVRTLAFRATPDLVEAVNAGAARAGKSVGGFIRDALSAALGMPSSDFGPARGTGQQPAATPTPLTQTAASAPSKQSAAAVAAPVVSEPPVVVGQVEQQAAPIAGPGALRAAHNDRLPSVVVEASMSEPVELNQPKKAKDDDAERRWFNS